MNGQSRENINNCSESEEKKRVEDAKSRAMSNERRAITELFKEFKFEVTDVSSMKKIINIKEDSQKTILFLISELKLHIQMKISNL